MTAMRSSSYDSDLEEVIEQLNSLIQHYQF